MPVACPTPVPRCLSQRPVPITSRGLQPKRRAPALKARRDPGLPNDPRADAIDVEATLVSPSGQPEPPPGPSPPPASQLNTEAGQKEPISTGDGIDSEQFATAWDALLQRDQRRSEAMRLLLMRRLQRIRTGRWPSVPSMLSMPSEPAPSETLRSTFNLQSLDEAAGSADAAASTRGAGQAGGRLAVRSPWLTSLFAWTTVITFVWQWWSLLPVLLQSMARLDLEALAAFALIVPETPAARSWSLDVFSLAAGNWRTVWSSCFVHSGLLSVIVCTTSLMETGSLLEESFGPLVLLLHVGMCAAATALSQAMLQPTVHAVAGPGIAAGLVVAVLVHQARFGSGPLTERLQLSLPSWIVLPFTFAVSLCQPLLGLWGWLAACLSGAVAALSCFTLLRALRYCIFGPLFLLSWALEVALMVALAIPRTVVFCVKAVWTLLAQLLSAIASSIQDIR